MKESEKCANRILSHYESRMADLKKLWNLYKEDSEASDPDLGSFAEYGLAFDYVAPKTFEGQKEGYCRYQISTGGPAEEFRFYINPDLSVFRIEFWFLDWFDGANKTLKDADFDFMEEIFDCYFRDSGTVEYAVKEAS